MSLTAFETLPKTARLWCFGSDRELSQSEREQVEDELGRFLAEWAAHGRALAAGFRIVENRFLLVAVDEGAGGASGCSIDALVTELKRFETRLGTSLLDGNRIWYRSEETEIRSISRKEFRRQAAAGVIGPQTVVFDLTLTTLAEVPDRFEVAAGRSWHAALLSDSVSGAKASG